MIVAKTLSYVTADEARQLDWKRLTKDFDEPFVEAFVDMQNNQSDKLTVIDIMIDALRKDVSTMIFGAQSLARLTEIRELVEGGLYSPYREVQRLMLEGRFKDQRIDELMSQLQKAKMDGDSIKEDDLLERIINEAMTLGAQVAMYTEILLRRVYEGTTGKWITQVNKLKTYIQQCAQMQFSFQQPVGIVAPGATITPQLPDKR